MARAARRQRRLLRPGPQPARSRSAPAPGRTQRLLPARRPAPGRPGATLRRPGPRTRRDSPARGGYRGGDGGVAGRRSGRCLAFVGQTQRQTHVSGPCPRPVARMARLYKKTSAHVADNADALFALRAAVTSTTPTNVARKMKARPGTMCWRSAPAPWRSRMPSPGTTPTGPCPTIPGVTRATVPATSRHRRLVHRPAAPRHPLTALMAGRSRN
ncbi:hypothetical protein D3C76_1042350 [compost metagenome]